MRPFQDEERLGPLLVIEVPGTLNNLIWRLALNMSVLGPSLLGNPEPEGPLPLQLDRILLFLSYLFRKLPREAD